MHELSLTEGIINIINSEREKQHFEKVIEISLKIGELSGVIPECIEEFFPIAAKGSAAEGAKLKLEAIPAMFECPDCAWRGKLTRHNYKCEACGSYGVKMVSGREFYVESIKVE